MVITVRRVFNQTAHPLEGTEERPPRPQVASRPGPAEEGVF